jgi:rhodanese-related sulfurtransferase
LPEALHLPIPQLQPKDPRLQGKQRRLVVYDRDAQDPLAPAAAKKLLAQGYTNVYVLRSGMEGWQNTAPPATTQPAPAEAEAGE